MMFVGDFVKYHFRELVKYHNCRAEDVGGQYLGRTSARNVGGCSSRSERSRRWPAGGTRQELRSRGRSPHDFGRAFQSSFDSGPERDAISFLNESKLQEAGGGATALLAPGIRYQSAAWASEK